MTEQILDPLCYKTFNELMTLKDAEGSIPWKVFNTEHYTIKLRASSYEETVRYIDDVLSKLNTDDDVHKTVFERMKVDKVPTHLPLAFNQHFSWRENATTNIIAIIVDPNAVLLPTFTEFYDEALKHDALELNKALERQSSYAPELAGYTSPKEFALIGQQLKATSESMKKRLLPELASWVLASFPKNVWAAMVNDKKSKKSKKRSKFDTKKIDISYTAHHSLSQLAEKRGSTLSDTIKYLCQYEYKGKLNSK